MQRLKDKRLTLKEAAQLPGVSTRQVKRLARSYQEKRAPRSNGTLLVLKQAASCKDQLSSAGHLVSDFSFFFYGKVIWSGTIALPVVPSGKRNIDQRGK
jgi:hypothetical protein